MLYDPVRRGYPCTTRLSLVVLLGLLALTVIPRGALMADLATGEVSTLALKGLPLPSATAGFSGTGVGTEQVITVAAQQVTAGTTGRLLIDLRFPAGYHLNPQAPLSYRVQVSGTGIDIAEPDRQCNTIAPPLPLAVPFRAVEGIHQATVEIDLTFYYCREDNTGVCVIQSVRWLVPLHTVPDGSAAEPVVSYQAEAPVLQKQL
jgi:hypothetical protein